MVGSVVEAERFDMKSTSHANQHLERLGALCYFCNRFHVISVMLGILADLLSGVQKPHSLIILLASDSTPLPTAPDSGKRHAKASSAASPSDGSSCTAIVVRSLMASSRSYQSTSRKHSKVMQSEVRYVVSVYEQYTGSSKDVVVSYELEVLCNLQQLDRGTGENAFQSWKQVLYIFCLHMIRDFFEREGLVVKANLADRDGANGTADDAWHAEVTAAWHLRVPCVLHMCHTSTGAAVNLQPMLNSGVLGNQLTLKLGSSSDDFFNVLVDTLVASADLFVDEAPPPEDSPTRLQQALLIDLFLHESEVDKRRALILKGNLVGDFHEHRIPVFASSADAGTSPESREAFIRQWAYDTALALYVPTSPLQRGRWMLNAKAYSEHGLLANVNDLGRRTFEVFNAKHKPLSKSQGLEATSATPAASASGFALPAVVELKPRGTAAGSIRDVPGADATDSKRDDAIAEENKRLRGDALAFWQSDPAGLLAIMCTCLLVMSELFRQLVEMSGVKFDRKQAASEAAGKGRKFRLFEAATGRWTREFFETADRLMSGHSAWDHLPRRFQTERNQSYAYAILAKLIAGVRHHVGVFQLFPFVIWTLPCAGAERSAAALALLTTPICMVDEKFGRPFLARFSTLDALCGSCCLTLLLVLAMVVRCDTGRVECRYASIRRLLLAKSTTWTSLISKLSANYVCSQARTSEFSCVDADDELEADPEEDAAPSQGYGGPARYFVRKWLSGQYDTGGQSVVGRNKQERSKSFTKMWETYRDIRQRGGEEWAELVNGGAMGTVASRIGAPSFGPKPSQIPVATLPRFLSSTNSSATAHGEAAPSEATDGSVLALAARGAAPSTLAVVGLRTFEDRAAELARMSATARQQGQQSREEEQRDRETLRSWSEAKLADLTASLLRVVPGVLVGAVLWPTQVLPTVRWIRCKTNVLGMVKKVFANASGGFLATVDSAWEQMHTPFQHLNAPALDLSKRSSRTLCYYARVCVCKRPDLQLFVKALVKSLKRYCCKGGQLRQLLDQNALVVYLVPLVLSLLERVRGGEG